MQSAGLENADFQNMQAERKGLMKTHFTSDTNQITLKLCLFPHIPAGDIAQHSHRNTKWR